MYAPIFFHDKKTNKVDFFSTDDGAKVSDSLCFFEGCGVVSGVFVKNAIDLKNVEGIEDLSLEDDYLRCSGSYCIYIVREGKFKIYPDPLGACLLYKYDSASITAYSSDLDALVDYISNRGESVNPDPLYMAMLLKMGNGGFGVSSYKNISVISPRVYIELGCSGVKEKEYFTILPEDINEDNYEKYKRLALNDIRQNIKAIKKSAVSNIICHLTGGFDSRLVAAAVAEAELVGRASFFCSGPEALDDKRIAYGIAGLLGWPLTEFNGLQGDRGEVFEGIALGVKFSSGMRSSSPVNENHKRNEDFLILSGGYGECYRSFYSKKANEFENGSFWREKQALTQEANRNIEILTKHYIEEKQKEGFPLGVALDLMYVEQRNRYFVGNIATLFSRKTARFDPLYSVNAVKAALCLDDGKRQDNYLGYELMREIGEKVLKVEFNENKFGKSVYEMYSEAGKKTVPLSRPKSFIYQEMCRVTKPSRPTGYKDEEMYLAKKLKATPWQVNNYSGVKKKCIELINNKSLPDDFGGVLNISYIEKLCNEVAPKNRVELRALYSIYSVLIFVGICSERRDCLSTDGNGGVN
ncbi:hypothetical protein [Cobetia sp. QF-1]|uniref:hypothetical protein n=1 Tax=Cobetia sp. QF-1 TaxID=1969833 RepID=UPI000B545649|nr:hypothetical protein [Cobetia sp. QF-1]